MDLGQLLGAAVVAAAVSAVFQLAGSWRDRAQREAQSRREHERAKLEIAVKMMQGLGENGRALTAAGQVIHFSPPALHILQSMRAIDEIESGRSWHAEASVKEQMTKLRTSAPRRSEDSLNDNSHDPSR